MNISTRSTQKALGNGLFKKKKKRRKQNVVIIAIGIKIV